MLTWVIKLAYRLHHSNITLHRLAVLIHLIVLIFIHLPIPITPPPPTLGSLWWYICSSPSNTLISRWDNSDGESSFKVTVMISPKWIQICVSCFVRLFMALSLQQNTYFLAELLRFLLYIQSLQRIRSAVFAGAAVYSFRHIFLSFKYLSQISDAKLYQADLSAEPTTDNRYKQT